MLMSGYIPGQERIVDFHFGQSFAFLTWVRSSTAQIESTLPGSQPNGKRALEQHCMCLTRKHALSRILSLLRSRTNRVEFFLIYTSDRRVVNLRCKQDIPDSRREKTASSIALGGRCDTVLGFLCSFKQLRLRPLGGVGDGRASGSPGS